MTVYSVNHRTESRWWISKSRGDLCMVSQSRVSHVAYSCEP